MISQVTCGIKISVKTSFEGTYFKNYRLHFAFSYHITIENQGKDSVQLQSRHWEIFDALNHPEIVDGEGVVGKKPTLKPGETRYEIFSASRKRSPGGNRVKFRSYVNWSVTLQTVNGTLNLSGHASNVCMQRLDSVCR